MSATQTYETLSMEQFKDALKSGRTKFEHVKVEGDILLTGGGENFGGLSFDDVECQQFIVGEWSDSSLSINRVNCASLFIGNDVELGDLWIYNVTSQGVVSIGATIIEHGELTLVNIETSNVITVNAMMGKGSAVEVRLLRPQTQPSDQRTPCWKQNEQ